MTTLLKDIAVLFDASESGQQILDTASRLAGGHASHLIGITALAQQPATLQAGFAKGEALHEVIVRHQSVMAARALQLGQHLNDALSRHAVSGELRVISHAESSSESSLHALYCDLLVVSHPNIPASPLTWSAPQILQQSGIPILIVPRDWADKPVGKKVLVAWNGSRQSRRAIADAMPMLIKAEAVTLLIIDAERNAELHGEEPGADMAAYLARHHVKVDLQRVTSAGVAIAEVIVAHAKNAQCDMVVFGAYSRPKLSEALFGGVTRTLLAEVPVPLFVSQ